MDLLSDVNYPNIYRYCKNLSSNHKYPYIERIQITDKIISILNRKYKNNVLLLGDTGVGKSLLIENLSKNIIIGKSNFSLINKKIFKLDFLSLSAGIRQRIEIENRFKSIIEEISQHKKIILFIDDIHNLFQTENVRLSNILNAALENNEIQCIGATTYDEYYKYFEDNKSLSNKFQNVVVEQTSLEETEKILNAIKSSYENYYLVSFSPEIIKKSVALADKFVINKKFPIKAIDILDEIGSYVATNNNLASKKIYNLLNQVSDIRNKQIKSASTLDFKKAIEYRNSTQALLTQIDFLNEKLHNQLQIKKIDVTEEDVANVIAIHSGIPLGRILQRGNKDIEKIGKILKQQIIGQDEAIDTVTKSIYKSYYGFQNQNHPIGVFLFLGPTGVGKTELTKLLSKHLFKTDESFIQVNMNEFIEKHDVYKLIGSPPGYIGYQDGGFLIKKVKKCGHCLILFDEIEKAHKEVHKILLQIMDSGLTTDVNGNIVDFRNTIIIMTSNIGFNFEDMHNIGFSEKLLGTDENKNVNNELLKYFSLEFINRIDETIVFKSIDTATEKIIIDKKLKALCDNMKKIGFDISLGSKLKTFLYQKCYSPLYGARYINRMINKYLESFIFDKISNNEIEKDKSYFIDISNNEIFIKKIAYIKK